jgi:hypothetical protein
MVCCELRPSTQPATRPYIRRIQNGISECEAHGGARLIYSWSSLGRSMPLLKWLHDEEIEYFACFPRAFFEFLEE